MRRTVQKHYPECRKKIKVWRIEITFSVFILLLFVLRKIKTAKENLIILPFDGLVVQVQYICNNSYSHKS